MDRGFLFHEISNRIDKSWNWIETKTSWGLYSPYEISNK
jgi:hypothetical protein